MTGLLLRTFAAGIAALLVAALSSSPVSAKKDRDGEAGAAAAGRVAFSVEDRRAIADYYADPRHREGGERPLPPGIAKKVARGGSLPPGIAKRYLPRDLDTRLPPQPAGVERIVVGSDVLLVEAATGLIYDIVKDALRGR